MVEGSPVSSVARVRAAGGSISYSASGKQISSGSSSKKVSDKQRARVLAHHKSTPRGHFEGHQTPDVAREPEEVRKVRSREKKRGVQYSQVVIKDHRGYIEQEKRVAAGKYAEDIRAQQAARKEPPGVRSVKETVTQRLGRYSASMEMQASRARAKGKSGMAYAMGAVAVGGLQGAAMFGGGLIQAVRHPVQTAKSIGYAATHPHEVGYAFGEAMRTRPAQTTGQVAGVLGASYGLSKAVGYGYKQARARMPVKVKALSPEKTLTKTKGSKLTTRATAKTRVAIDKNVYEVESIGRGKGLSKAGKTSELGKIKHKVTKVKSGQPTRLAGTHYSVKSTASAGKIRSASESRTLLKYKPKKYAAAHELEAARGSQVMRVDRPVSITQFSKKGGSKILKQEPFAVYQFKRGSAASITKGRAPHIKKFFETGKTSLKPSYSGGVSVVKMTKGVRISRSFGKPSSVAVYKGSTYKEAFSPKKTVFTAMGKSKASAAPLLRSKKAQIASYSRPSSTKLGLQKVRVLPPQTGSVARKSAIQAARLAYLTEPIKARPDLTIGLAGTAIAGRSRDIFGMRTPTREAPKIAVAPVQRIIPDVIMKPSRATMPKAAVAPVLRSVPTTEQRFVAPPAPVTPSGPGVIPVPPTTPLILPPMRISPLEFFEEKAVPSVLKKQKKAYQPSLIGIDFKLKGAKPRRISGIGVRPLLR